MQIALPDNLIVRSRAALRIGLAGGGTDVSPYCDLHGGCVLNASIDRFVYTTIQPRSDDRIEFVSLDQGLRLNIGLDEIDRMSDSLHLHRACYLHIIKKYNNGINIPLNLSTYADAPIGSGLGTSSTLVVSMIKAFCELLNIPMDDYQVAHTAYVIEREECGFAGGKQDQYSAAFGGFNFIEFFENSRVVVNPLRIRKEVISELEASFLLAYSGISRESAKIIDKQAENIKSMDPKTLEGMHHLKIQAIAMKEGMLKGDFKMIEESLRAGWENKRITAKNISNQLIENIFSTAYANGAKAGKVSGAGGGGFILFMFDPKMRSQLFTALENIELKVSNCHFTEDGSHSWRRYI